jgi:hypothetical protein
MNRFTKISLASAVTLAAGVAVVHTVSAEPCPVEVTVSNRTPARGFASGGTEVTLTGSNFQTCDVGRISFGGSNGNITQRSNTELKVVTPPGAGSVVPTLYYGDDQSAVAAEFTYVPVPVVDRMLPPKGPAGGGTAVVIWGADLEPPGSTTQVRFGDVAVDTTMSSGTYLEAVSPSHDPGTVDVSVVITLDTGEQGASTPEPFTFVPAPTVAAIDPDTGSSDGGDVVEISGSDFQRGARVLLGRADGAASTDASARFDGSNAAPVVEVVDSGLLRVMIPNGAPGVANLIVLNPDDQIGVLLDAFTYSGQAPVLSAVTPADGPSLGGTQVTITGTGFLDGATVEFGSGDTRSAAQSVVVVSSTEITATAPAHPGGVATVTVTNPDRGTATLPGSFTYTPSAAPTLASIAPLSGSSLGGANMTLLGSGFASGAVVRFGDLAAGGVEVPGAVIDAGRITATSPPMPAGPVDVRVVNPDGAVSTAIAYTVQPAPAPTVGSVSPTTGPTAGGTTVTITGTGFADGAVVLVGGVEVTAQTDPVQGVLPIVRSATTIVAVTPPGVDGPVDVEVVNPDRASVTAVAAFEYDGPPPATLDSISPDVGTSAGGVSVTLAGSNFAAGSVVTFGNGDCVAPKPPACNIRASDVVITPTSITAVTPAGLFGHQNVSVVGPDGTSATLRYGFDFGDGATPPAIVDIDPAVGPTGATVTLSGSGFVPGAQAYVGSRPLTGVVETDAQGAASTLPIVRDAATVVGVVPRRSGGTFPVAVANPDGQGVIVVDGFSYPTDTTAPTTSASATTGNPPVAYVFGATSWARGPVSVELVATDGLGGSGVDSITYSATGAQVIPSTTAPGARATLLVTRQGVTTLQYGALDIAGVAEQPTTRVVAIDSIAPTITSSSTFVPGTQTNQDVDVVFTCTDNVGGSGLGSTPLAVASTTAISEAGDNPLTATFTDPGIGQSVTATCTDLAGNVATKVFGGVNISTDGPTLTAVATTADGRTYPSGTWTNLNVVVTFVCRAPAGIAPLGSPQVASVTAPQIISSGVTDHTVDGECRDSAGNVVTASFGGINVDKTRPVAAVAATTAGAPYASGSWTNQPVVLTFSCTDDGPDQSGVASVSGPLTISSPGSTAGGTGDCTDTAGNRADPAVFLGPILIDVEAPTCSVLVSPNPIVPANNKLAPVGVTVLTTDGLSGVETVRLVSVTTNRPATASSDIAGFALGSDDRTGSLRATKGNVYTLTYVVVDRGGNESAPCTATVTPG